MNVYPRRCACLWPLFPLRRAVQPVQPLLLSDPGLSVEQQIIVDAPLDCAVRVLAGPGAGKTTVQIEREVRVLDSGVPPEAITAVTFTAAMARQAPHLHGGAEIGDPA